MFPFRKLKVGLMRKYGISTKKSKPSIFSQLGREKHLLDGFGSKRVKVSCFRHPVGINREH